MDEKISASYVLSGRNYLQCWPRWESFEATAISAFKKNFLTVGVACWLPDPAVSMSHACGFKEGKYLRQSKRLNMHPSTAIAE